MTYLKFVKVMDQFGYRVKVLGRGKDIFVLDENGAFVAEIIGTVKGRIKYAPNSSHLLRDDKDEIVYAIENFADTSIINRMIYSVA